MADFIPQYNQAPTPAENRTPEKQKRILLLTGITVVALLIGILAYFLIFKKSPTTPPAGETFPVGGNVITQEQPTVIQGGETQPTTQAPGQEQGVQKLVELYKGPVAGYTVLRDGRTIRLFDRTLGRLVEVSTTNYSSTTVSDQPILGIHDATFVGEDKLIVRGIDGNGNIKTTLYTIDQTGDSNAPLSLDNPIALADNVLELAASQDASKVVLVIKDPLGANIDVLDIATQTLKRKGTLPLSEWIPSITNDGTIYLSAKASRFAMSGTYKLSNKQLIMSIPAGIAQTTAIAPSGSIAFVSGSYGNIYSSQLRDPDILSNVEASDVPFVTIAEKCSWSSDENDLYCGVPNTRGTTYPDSWYLGENHFSDMLERYDLTKGENTVLLNPEAYKLKLDIVDITPSAYAVFMLNNQDKHLWMYRLFDTTTTSSTSSATTSQEGL